MNEFNFDRLVDLTRRAIDSPPTRRRAPIEGGHSPRENLDEPLDDEGWDALLEELDRFRDCRVRTARPSHRPVVGPFISFAKRVFFRLARPLLHEVFETQARFNTTATIVLTQLVEERRRAREEAAAGPRDDRAK